MFLRSIGFSIVIFISLEMISISSLGGAESDTAAAETETAAKAKVEKAEAQEVAPLGDKLLEIGELCLAAKQDFSPVDEADLAAAKNNLLERIEILEKRLDRDGANGKAWRDYLKLDELKELLKEKKNGKAQDLKFAKIQERFDGSSNGLNLIWFAEVRRALWRYRTVANAIGNAEVKSGYEGLLSQLPIRLREYTRDPTAARAEKLGDVIAWMEAIDQAEKLLGVVRNEYRRPNLYLRTSQDLVAKGMFRDVDETGPITDCILGMSIRGEGHTTGTITAELIPNGDEAVIRMIMSAQTMSKNVGSRGVVRVYSDSVTTFEAEKLFRVDEEQIYATPATCRAETKSTITGVCATNGMRLIENIARKQVRKNQCKGDWIGARHAEERVSRRFDEQSSELLAEANESYVDRFRHPLWQRGLFPNELLFATLETGVGVTVLQAEADQLAAFNTPPELPGKPDVALRLHESFINNMAAEALGGRTLDEEQVMEMLKDTMGKIPEHFKADEGEEPWAISFALEQPVVLNFNNDKFTIKLSVDRFVRGDSDYPGMDITAHYQIVKSGDEYKAIRQGEVTILPPGFVVDKDKRLSVRQQAIRQLIGRRFDKAFRQEITAEPLELPNRWKKLGKLPLSHWRTENGWAVATWNLASDEKNESNKQKTVNKN